jgi:hypothetical protein
MMMDNHFRHLPVLGTDGSIVAVLDIAKCMYDAISKIEKLEASGKSVGGSNAAAEAMKNSVSTKGMNAQQAAMVQAMMSNMLSMFGGSTADLGAVLEKRDFEDIVQPTITVREAAKYMANIKKGVAVADESGALVGIFTLKDLNNRVLAKELDPDSTLVSEVMTPSPESVEPEMSLLDALHLMHDQKYLHLPVVCEGATKGLVDAMDVMNASQGDGNGSEGWRSFWEQTMDVGDDESDTASIKSAASSRFAHQQRPQRSIGSVGGKVAPKVPKLKLGGLTNGSGGGGGGGAGGGGGIDDVDEVGSQDLNGLDGGLSGSPTGQGGFEAPFTFKVADPSGNLHKVSASSERLQSLKSLLSDRLGCAPGGFDLKYVDEDGDEVLVSGDAALSETVDQARARGENFVRLSANFTSGGSGNGDGSAGAMAGAAPPQTPRERIVEAVTTPNALMIGGATAAALAVAGIVFMRRNRY